MGWSTQTPKRKARERNEEKIEHWKKLPVIGGITINTLYFQLHEESIKSAQVIDFLEHLQRQIKGRLLIVWDNLPAHRSKIVAEYLASTKERIWVERPPGYAPKLNPIKYLWGYAKGNDLANFAPKDLKELSQKAKKALRQVKRMPRCPRAFWVQSRLDLEGVRTFFGKIIKRTIISTSSNLK